MGSKDNRNLLRRYMALDMIQPGVSFEELVRVGIERGVFPDAIGREEEWIAERLESHRASRSSIELRTVGDRWFQISERRLPDGGSAGIRVDITELREARPQRSVFGGRPS